MLYNKQNATLLKRRIGLKMQEKNNNLHVFDNFYKESPNSGSILTNTTQNSVNQDNLG